MELKNLILFTLFFVYRGVSARDDEGLNPEGLYLVYQCQELRTALAQNTISGIIIKDCVTCSSGTWGSTFILDRNVTIRGSSECSLRWTTPGAAIIVQRNASLQFHSLTIGIFNFASSFLPSFLDTVEGGSVEFQNIVFEQRNRNGCWQRQRKLLEQTMTNHCLIMNKTTYCNSTILCRSRIEYTHRQTGLRTLNGSKGFSSKQNEEPGRTSGARYLSKEGVAIFIIIAVATIVVAMIGVSYLIILKKCPPAACSIRLCKFGEGFPNSSAISNSLFLGSNDSPTNSFVETIDVEKATFEWQIGKGEHGCVYKVNYEGKTVAIKVICSTEQKGGASNEAYLAQSALHPNVVRSFCTLNTEANDWSDLAGLSRDVSLSSSSTGSLEDFLESTSGSTTDQRTWLIVMEFCDIGNLKSILNDSHLRDNLEKAGVSRHSFLWNVALDISRGMQYLHNKSIVHGDLKPQNVLLQSNSTTPFGFIAKIADFGLSRHLTHNTLVRTKTCGSVRYSSPELLREGLMSMKTDVYSFGMVLWEMVVGVDPYFGKSEVEVMLMVSNGKRPQPLESIPGKLGVIIRLCLQEDYRDRPDFTHIIDTLQ